MRYRWIEGGIFFFCIKHLLRDTYLPVRKCGEAPRLRSPFLFNLRQGCSEQVLCTTEAGVRGARVCIPSGQPEEEIPDVGLLVKALQF